MNAYSLAMKIEVDLLFDEISMDDCDQLLMLVGAVECRRLRNRAKDELYAVKLREV
jgi:hypothetical protein